MLQYWMEGIIWRYFDATFVRWLVLKTTVNLFFLKLDVWDWFEDYFIPFETVKSMQFD